MIKGTFKRNDAGQIVSFTLTGHADAGPYGSDIVCAGVSALAISTVNGIASLAGFEPIVEMNEEEGGYLYTEVTSGMTQEQNKYYIYQLFQMFNSRKVPGNIEHLPAIRQVGIIADGESFQTKRLFLTFQQGEQGLRPIENAM